jgi:hypothetical protein
MTVFHPTEPYPSLVSARFWGTLVFLCTLLAISSALFVLLPPVVWSHRADMPVTLSPPDVWLILKQFAIPRGLRRVLGAGALESSGIALVATYRRSDRDRGVGSKTGVCPCA